MSWPFTVSPMDDQLGDVGMGGGDLFELLLEATWSAVRPEDRVARRGEARRHLCRRLAVDLLELEVDALVGELVGLLAAPTRPRRRVDRRMRRHGRDVARSMPEARSVSSWRRSSVPT